MGMVCVCVNRPLPPPPPIETPKNPNIVWLKGTMDRHFRESPSFVRKQIADNKQNLTNIITTEIQEKCWCIWKKSLDPVGCGSKVFTGGVGARNKQGEFEYLNPYTRF